ncbi:hypothetical protein QSV08_12455 [Maribacter sp. BPC-D8]|uniref:toxin-antitoxin system YwqK family antitoxin n=1 Tax=Maribacter sp. BPC-D8 TaxID=3053613 RepID=UPI002B4708F5|nr:hypothetical protein [Maribacter sp. BPC-D8]WRI28036.1 hypothetical protein QSV08_12455 [Maribacter sp. BPC-D8]
MRINNLKFLLVILSYFAISQHVNSQSKIYFNKDWKTTTKEEAQYYRILQKKNDSLFHIKDYYINGNLQMEGYFSNLEEETLEGENVFYTANGKISDRVNYKKGILHGLRTVYLENGKIDYTTEYVDGTVYEGVNMGGYYKEFYEKGKLIKMVEFDAPNYFNKLATRIYGIEKDTIYWMSNKGDELIGTGIYDSSSSKIIDGLDISHQLLIIVYTNYKNSKREGIQKVFYRNELLAEQTFVNDVVVLERSINPFTGETVEINFKDGEPYNGRLFQFDQFTQYYNEYIYKEGEVNIANYYELVDGKLQLNTEKSYKKTPE